MRLPPNPTSALVSLSILLLPSLTTAVNLDCEHIRDNGKSFNFKALDAVHSLSTVKEHPNTRKTTTFTFNICRPIGRQKGVPKDEDCPNGSRVCAIERIENKVEHSNITGDTIPIAGEFGHTIGGHLDPKWTRLKGSASSADRDKEGVRLEIHGGKDDDGNKQMAIMEFLCPPKQEESRRSYQALTAEDEDEDDGKKGEQDGADQSGEETEDGDGGMIKFLSWENEDSTKTLRLKWDTKHACEDAAEAGSGSSSGHWGFFTWFILIVFMAVAAYLIFGSWLNYNRYSARGWDLVPHSDTIRDLPYLFRDWIRRVVDTVQGGGSRGGYSAV